MKKLKQYIEFYKTEMHFYRFNEWLGQGFNCDLKIFSAASSVNEMSIVSVVRE